METTKETTEVKKYEIIPGSGMFTNEEQTKAVDYLVDFLLNSKEKEAVLIGKGGTGKTTIINVVKEIVKGLRKFNDKTKKQEEFIIYATAPSHNACAKLRECFDNEIPVYTNAAILGMKLDMYSGKFQVDEFARRENGVPIEECNVSVWDECSMIGEKAKGYIISFSDSQAKVIYMGDFRQLPPIREKGENPDKDADSPTFNVKNRVEISQRMRQGVESPILNVIDFYGDCIETNKFKQYPLELRVNNKTETGEVIFTKDPNWFLDSYVEEFANDPKNPYHIKGIAFTNEYRTRVNTALRKRLFKEQAIEQFVVGDMVTAFETYFISAAESIKNAESFSVTGIRKGRRGFEYTEMKTKDGEFMAFPEMIEVEFDTVFLDLECGEDFHMNIPVVAESSRKEYDDLLAHLFAKRMFKEAYQLKEFFADIQYGYVITSHKAQGHTYKNVWVLEDDIMGVYGPTIKTKFKSMYVAVSRPSRKLVLFSRR